MTKRGWSNSSNPWPGVKCANPECQHAATAHNDCGYCERWSRTKGDCPCQGFEIPIGPGFGDARPVICNDMCMTGWDVGMAEYGNTIIEGHPKCPLHGTP